MAKVGITALKNKRVKYLKIVKGSDDISSDALLLAVSAVREPYPTSKVSTVIPLTLCSSIYEDDILSKRIRTVTADIPVREPISQALQ